MPVIIFLGSLHLTLMLAVYFFIDTHPRLLIVLLIVSLYITFYLLNKQYRQQKKLLQSLDHGLQSLRDNDFSISLRLQKDANYDSVVSAFNQTSEKLREERQRLYQREMMLDKVLNASPMVTILVDHRDTIVFTNNSAQQAFELNESIVGKRWTNLVASLAPEFQHALQNQGESIFTLTDPQGSQQAWHVTSSSVTIHQARHQLFLLKSITQELSKQEVATWKKVISVISHELNNSIAPISSMCHSGELLAKNLDEPRLNRVFNTISGRVNHLNDFIKGYASLTKVKLPNKQLIDWQLLTQQLQALYPFALTNPLPASQLYADLAQLEQVFINVLKNAHEADDTGDISMQFEDTAHTIEITINDNGDGMSAEVIQNALLPFYSTKHSGTGLGLALCREIIEAHNGKLLFNNRDQGGLCVLIILPIEPI
ncbi:histidine kinase [Alteromonas sp. 5E99-2]|uniref:sensor histidine kinase n=1 Tax=Alteromonas sp. 5E99-2 TaxID=2817683 RepID=UPI001A98B49E|nr:ATP-binding protein [Alteromonas sp. 5E99-2]MBO1256055.1 histidine kinase [Alteromonas sp. 5E99-2]